jgi:hypothetical protein
LLSSLICLFSVLTCLSRPPFVHYCQPPYISSSPTVYKWWWVAAPHTWQVVHDRTCTDRMYVLSIAFWACTLLCLFDILTCFSRSFTAASHLSHSTSLFSFKNCLGLMVWTWLRCYTMSHSRPCSCPQPCPHPLWYPHQPLMSHPALRVTCPMLYLGSQRWIWMLAQSRMAEGCNALHMQWSLCSCAHRAHVQRLGGHYMGCWWWCFHSDSFAGMHLTIFQPAWPGFTPLLLIWPQGTMTLTCKNPYPKHRYGFWWVRVRVGLKYPRVTPANPYASAGGWWCGSKYVGNICLVEIMHYAASIVAWWCGSK